MLKFKSLFNNDHQMDTQDRVFAQKGIKSTLAGMVVNLLLAIVKGVSGYIGNSYALIADSIESLTDVGSSFIVWIGLKISLIPPDENHPYGHGKAEPIAAIIVSLTLLSAAITIIYQSIQEIINPHGTPAPFTLFILVIVILTKELLFRFVIDVGKEIKSTAVKTDAWHHRSDAITSLFCFFGIIIALVGGKGFEVADDYAALFASFIIIFNSYILIKPAIAEIMDAKPEDLQSEEIISITKNIDAVVNVSKCLIRKVGFSYYIELDVEIDGAISVRNGHKIAHDIKDLIKQMKPLVYDVLVHIEPAD